MKFKARIKKRALDMYLGSQSSMPPADVAVRLAKVLGVTVEYLVTGEQSETEAPQEHDKKITFDFKQIIYLANIMPKCTTKIQKNIFKNKLKVIFY